LPAALLQKLPVGQEASLVQAVVDAVTQTPFEHTWLAAQTLQVDPQ
jgi:hypothetical protein